jgi:hypothetical protein
MSIDPRQLFSGSPKHLFPESGLAAIRTTNEKASRSSSAVQTSVEECPGQQSPTPSHSRFDKHLGQLGDIHRNPSCLIARHA